MDNEQIAEYFREHWLLILSFNFVLGLIFGAIPLFLAIRRGKRNLGIIALVVTAILSVPSFLLGLLSATIFTIILIVKGKANSVNG